MATRIHDVTIYTAGDTLPENYDGPECYRESIEQHGGHVAVFDDGSWMATFVPHRDDSPIPRFGVHWASVDEFHDWVRKARK